MFVYAKCPEGVTGGYLTPGKLYKVISDEGGIFNMHDDDGVKINTLWSGSSHTNGKDWERIESGVDKLNDCDDTLTIRDQFAMAVITHCMGYDTYSEVAKDACELADAMLEARKANNEAA